MAASSKELNSGKIKAANFLEASIGALKVVLPRVYAGIDSTVPLPPAVLCGNQNWLRSLYRAKGEVSTRNMPFFGYVVTNFQKNRSGYGWDALQRIGARAGVMANGQDWLIMHLTPVLVTVKVAFIGNSYDQFIHFSARWMQKHRDLSFPLSIGGTGREILVKVMGEESLTAPELPSESDNGELFIYETSLTMETYSGYFHKVPGIVNIQGNLTVLTQQQVAQFREQGVDLPAYSTLEFDVRIKDPSNPEL